MRADIDGRGRIGEEIGALGVIGGGVVGGVVESRVVKTRLPEGEINFQVPSKYTG